MMTTILVVDDSLTMRSCVARALESEGFEVIEADSGRQAFSRLGTHPEISLVVCDVNMPVIGGLALLERVRQEEQWRALPVIFLTADADKALLARAAALGAFAWVMKPLNPELLVATVKRGLGQSAQVSGLTPDTQAPADG
jgi:two-component system chemotaxis response regulator CheY